MIIGIDLGTTNSCVSVFRNNNFEIIPDEYGNRTIPSIVSFTNNDRFVGKSAKNIVDLNPKNAIYEVKRLIGRNLSDINDLEFFSYNIAENKESNGIDIITSKRIYSPEEISSIILIKLKNMASNYLKQDITQAVITVPAYFNDSQRQATKDAATIAGLDIVRIINEPTSAALAYGLLNRSTYNDKTLNVLVYDLGGGTLDCSLLTITDGIFEVLGSSGNTHLGGSDFDTTILRFVIDDFIKKNKLDNLDNLICPLSLQQLRISCENAKISLSDDSFAPIFVKNFYNNIDLNFNLTQEKLREICQELLIMCMKPIDDILDSCEFDKKDINEIILVGGMTRMPAIRDNIKRFIGKEPNCSVNPDEVVAIGASIQAHLLYDKSDPFSENVTLLDVVSLSLGVETNNGLFDIIIPRNTNIPTSKTKKYSCDTDNVTSVKIKIFEGERQFTKDNYLVGEFELSGIDPCLRGMPEIDIKFAIDVNGIITVSATNNKNSKKTLVITGNKGRLKKEEIDSLIIEAKEYELKDKLAKNIKESYDQLNDLCSVIIENVNDHDYKLVDSDIKIVENEINSILLSLDTNTDYSDVIKKLQNKYSTLILRKCTIDELNKIKSNETTSGHTNIYDDDDNISYDNLEKKDNISNSNNMSEIDIIKSQIVELCNSLSEIISDDTFIHSNKIELSEYIDDTLLWVYAHQKPTVKELSDKLAQINDKFNNISGDVFRELSKKEEFEQLKNDLIYNIPNMTIQDSDKNLLYNIIEASSGDEYDKYISQINELCNNIYSHSQIKEQVSKKN